MNITFRPGIQTHHYPDPTVADAGRWTLNQQLYIGGNTQTQQSQEQAGGYTVRVTRQQQHRVVRREEQF
jgi:hypothetical protein